MQKAYASAFSALLENNGAAKLSNPSVTRGATAVPRDPSLAAKVGIRLDYDNWQELAVGPDIFKYHRYQLQVNAGDSIPHAFKAWRDKQKRGTHAVMAVVLIKEGASREEVFDALMEAVKDVEGV